MFQALTSSILNSPDKLFWRFIVLHLIVWTLLPAIFHPNMPIDATETITWGHEWQLGYERHPPLTSWLAEIAVTLSGQKLWSYFLLSQLCIITGFWAIWKLAQEWLDKPQSLIAVLLLEGVYYYNFTSPEFNPNVLLLGLWPLTTLFFRRALFYNNTRAWLLCGLFAALSTITKYHTAFLLTSMLAVLLATAEYRKTLTNAKLWSAGIVFCAIITPHLYWVIQNDFTTINYGVNRSTAIEADFANIRYPLKFAGSQILALLLMLIMASTLGWKNRLQKNSQQFDPFLWIICFGPFLITFLLSAAFGMRLRSMWGTPYWALSGIIVMIWLRPQINNPSLKRFTIAFAGIFIFVTSAYVAQMTVKLRDRAHFPGEQVAEFLTSEWHKRFNTKLEYVGARLWLGGNIGFYSEDRPSVYVELKSERSRWIDEQDFINKGGILAWEISVDGQGIPADWLNRFPGIEVQAPITFEWRRFNEKNPLVKIGWAFLKPAKN